MIYTSYLSKLKQLPNDENTIKILVIRWKPRNMINMERYNTEWWPSLAPSELILSKYKDGSINWEEYRKMFLEHAENKTFKESIQKIIELNTQGKDIFLICYEKDDLMCHRSIIREILSSYLIDSAEYKE